MSTEFHSYTREEFITEFVHPDDRQALLEARERRVAQAMEASQRRVSAIENGSIAELTRSAGPQDGLVRAMK
ncbi:hypothetical protein FH608_021695 [Nonomuraea phyllanthi]|uniref:Uncharacterized protein n=1 Tax=Nonomuraea phyllanthi TaxID=2219224 RepID=A0A5C4WHU8_9ACTN|nr:hypothetical protein [Nonomuraea phyllanthi]KAB8193809.1 hypothetical protein FH608_021695 [Nonomuraea phyllanthi]QFY12548.1 hypothetical protein GBF35_43585 [Nonomuraea phyllanthi]